MLSVSICTRARLLDACVAWDNVDVSESNDVVDAVGEEINGIDDVNDDVDVTRGNGGKDDVGSGRLSR